MNFDWIVNKSNLPWLKLDISFPYQEMYEEAKALKNRFVAHRDQDGSGGYQHKGWKSLCIHGISAESTNHYDQYGYKSNDEAPYIWTDIIDQCPVTYTFFKCNFPYKKYYRVRYMLLEPGGFISPHKDMHEHKLSPVNIALNNPKTCKMKMVDHEGFVPFTSGSALMLDVGNMHTVYNKSSEDRYHIIVHGIKSKEFEELVEDSYEKNGG